MTRASWWLPASLSPSNCIDVKYDFPIIQEDWRAKAHGKMEFVPTEIVLMHENQCFVNHMQSVDTLARRGGLSWRELLAVLYDVRFRAVEDAKLSEDDCRRYCKAFIEKEEAK